MKKRTYSLKSFSLFYRAMANTKHEMWISVQVLVIITVILSIILYIVEHIAQPEVYSSIWDSALWAFMSYIGDPGHFADYSPVTFVGRIIAMLIGIIGIAIFAVPAGIIGSGFIDAIAEDKKEKQLNEASVVLHKRFRRISQSKSWFYDEKKSKITYKFVPRYRSLAHIQVKTGMTVDEIIAAVNYSPDMRLMNLATAQRQEEKPQDRLVVVNFPLNREYGCCVDRASDVTIVSPCSTTEPGTGSFAYSLAAMGGFNYVSKEIAPNPDDPFGFYTMSASKLKVIGDYDTKEDVESQALHFMHDLENLKSHSTGNNRKHWFVFILGTSNSTDTQVHFWRLANDSKKTLENRITADKEYGSTVLSENEADFQQIVSESVEALGSKTVTIKDQEQSIVTSLDNCDLLKGVGYSNIMCRMGGGKDCNAFSIRIGYEILVFHTTHLLIAKDLADAIKRHTEPEREIPEEARKCFMKEGDGFADDFGKTDVFKQSPKELKELMEQGREEAREKYEHLDLDGNEQSPTS